MDYDKINDGVAFKDDTHTYWNVNTGVKYTSVTTLVGKFEQPYDKDFWSGYKALEKMLPSDIFSAEKKRLIDTKKIDIEYFVKTYNIDELEFKSKKQDVLDAWQEENFKSCERGTKIHAGIEQNFLDAGTCELQKYGLGGKFVVRAGDVPLDEEKGVYPEYLIHVDDDNLHLAGQIDLLIKDGNDLYIYDWKGLPLETKIPTPEGWSTIKDLNEGDFVYDKNGDPTKILHKSEVHNNPCFKITFDNGESIVADHEHRWEIAFKTELGFTLKVLTTEELLTAKNAKILNPKPIKGAIENIENPYEVGKSLPPTIPDIYQRASYKQRIEFVKGIMSVCGGIKDRRYVIHNYKEAIKILASLGIKCTVVGNDILFTTTEFNPTNDGTLLAAGGRNYRSIISVEPVETVPTQCLEVDSPTHTFLCTESMIVTHNTNKKLTVKGFYDKKLKSTVKMRYPLNELDDVNFSHYTMQLSIYAWMLQHNNPKLNIKRLKLVHFDHNNNRTEYDIEYKKPTVERLLRYWKQLCTLEERKQKRKEIVF